MSPTRQISTAFAALVHDADASPSPYTLPLRGGDDIRAKTRALCKRLRHSLVDLLYLDSYDVKSGTSDVGSSEHHLEELTAAFDSGLVARGHTLVVVDDNFDADRHEFDGGDGGGGSNAEEVCDGALSEAVRCVTILTRRSRARADF
mmetsp:Transcript_97916/g.280071  ORF Transcript_97916/g.280071 Transcript_97916/m.280071 type:complete len:147 (-) Transcript_97916:181-621(-)